MLVKRLNIGIGVQEKTYKLSYEKALKILTEKGEKETQAAFGYYSKRNIHNKFFNNARIQALFLEIFKTSLNNLQELGPIHILTGQDNIDIFKLERFLQVPENESMHDYIQKNYGVRGVKLVKKLI